MRKRKYAAALLAALAVSTTITGRGDSIKVSVDGKDYVISSGKEEGGEKPKESEKETEEAKEGDITIVESEKASEETEAEVKEETSAVATGVSQDRSVEHKAYQYSGAGITMEFDDRAMMDLVKVSATTDAKGYPLVTYADGLDDGDAIGSRESFTLSQTPYHGKATTEVAHMLAKDMLNRSLSQIGGTKEEQYSDGVVSVEWMGTSIMQAAHNSERSKKRETAKRAIFFKRGM